MVEILGIYIWGGFFFLYWIVDFYSVCNLLLCVFYWFIGDINSNYNEINMIVLVMLYLIYYSVFSDFFYI